MKSINKVLSTIEGCGNKRSYKATIEDLKQVYTIIQTKALLPLHRAFKNDEDFSEYLNRPKLKRKKIVDKFKKSKTFTGYMLREYPIEEGFSNFTLSITIPKVDELCEVLLSYEEKERQQHQEIKDFILNLKE